MTSNNPTTLISLLGTEPSFKENIDRGIKTSPLFIKELSNSLPCVKSITPLITEFKEELSLLYKNYGSKNQYNNSIQVVAEEMQLIIPNTEAELSLDKKVQLRNKNNLKINF